MTEHNDTTGYSQFPERRFYDQMIFGLRNSLDNHIKDNDERLDRMETAITTLAEETRDVVQLQKDFQGAVRLGERIRTAVDWFIKFPLVGGGAYYFYKILEDAIIL